MGRAGRTQELRPPKQKMWQRERCFGRATADGPQPAWRGFWGTLELGCETKMSLKAPPYIPVHPGLPSRERPRVDTGQWLSAQSQWASVAPSACPEPSEALSWAHTGTLPCLRGICSFVSLPEASPGQLPGTDLPWRQKS